MGGGEGRRKTSRCWRGRERKMACKSAIRRKREIEYIEGVCVE